MSVSVSMHVSVSVDRGERVYGVRSERECTV